MTDALDLDGPAAPPRANGELVFEHPWQRRTFATTMALCDAGVVDYDRFRDELIARIGEQDATGDEDYWAAWQDALEGVLTRDDICEPAELARRATAFADHR